MKRYLFKAFNRFMYEYENYQVRELKKRLKSCGQNVFISPKAIIWSESSLEIGDNVCIHGLTHIFAGGGIQIGSGSMISSNCSITSVTHAVNQPDRTSGVYQPITIGRNVWIGTGAIILPGISIGDHAVIGAGSVVTKDVPAMQVVVGSPARTLRSVQFQPLDLPQYSNVR